MKTPSVKNAFLSARRRFLFLLGFAFPAFVFAQSASVMHLINDSSQDAGNVLTGPGATFTTDFQGTNDLKITVLASQVSSDYEDTYPASPGNNPPYLSGFVGNSANGTGNGSVGNLDLLQTYSDGTNRTSLQFDFSIPLTSGDRVIIPDTDTDEQVTIQAFDAADQPVSLTGWTHEAFSGQTGIAPDSQWAIWNPTGAGADAGTLTSNADGDNLNEPLDVFTPDQSISHLIFTESQGHSGGTEEIQFIAAPEPSAIVFVVIGAIGLATCGRRRRATV